MTIQEFIDKDEYFDSYRYSIEWNNYKVYEIWAKQDEGACIGYPNFALEKNGIIRKSKFEETLKIMKDLIKDDDEE